MSLHKQTMGNQAQIKVEGRLDVQQAVLLRETFSSLHQESINQVYLDMSQVSFMDSAGLAAVVSGLKATRGSGGELYVVDPSNSVRSVLELTLLDKIIPIRDSFQKVV